MRIGFAYQMLRHRAPINNSVSCRSSHMLLPIVTQHCLLVLVKARLSIQHWLSHEYGRFSVSNQVETSHSKSHRVRVAQQ